MFVLDYIRKTHGDGNSFITISPFHSGHLGYIPPIPVNVALFSSFKSGITQLNRLSQVIHKPVHCELIISSNKLHQNEDLAILECTLKDDLGLVNKLVSALSKHGINILTIENTSNNHSSTHSVSMVIDFTGSLLENRRTFKSSQNLYFRYSNLFPTNSIRYMRVFEDIMSLCYDKLKWSKFSGQYLPEFSIRPLRNLDNHHESGSAVIEDEKKRGTTKRELHPNLELKIPTRINALLRFYLKAAEDEPLYYILHSDTTERQLRAYFPIPKSENKVFHLAFHHNDLPGALISILDLLKHSGFNILSGVVRRRGEGKNIWESILEYRGKENNLPPFDQTKARFLWVSELLSRELTSHSRVKDFAVKIVVPSYPKPTGKDDYSNCFDEFNHKISSLPRKAKSPDNPTDIEILNSNLRIAERTKARDRDGKLVVGLLKTIKDRITRDEKPIIFLSYPSSAKSLAAAFKKRFESTYKIDDYQSGNGQVIREETRKKIRECDIFTGIWHEDKNFKAGKYYSTSPWMLFEYGIAYDDEKPVILLQSEKLDPKVAQRINPAKAELRYKKDTFATETLDEYQTILDRMDLDDAQNSAFL